MPGLHIELRRGEKLRVGSAVLTVERLSASRVKLSILAPPETEVSRHSDRIEALYVWRCVSCGDYFEVEQWEGEHARREGENSFRRCGPVIRVLRNV